MFDINRRDFLRNIFRFGIAGGLVALGFTLSSQSSESEPGAVECNKPNPCQQCNQFRGCTLPGALASLKRKGYLWQKNEKKDFKTKPQKNTSPTLKRSIIKLDW